MSEKLIPSPDSLEKLSASRWRRVVPIYQNDSIYDHLPVNIQTFIDSPHYMNASNDCWAQNRLKLMKLFDNHPEKTAPSTYQEFVFEAGIGSGKSYLITLLLAYMTYRLLCFKDPQKVYGLAKGSLISIVNMAKNGTQARKVVFGELKTRIENSPWFREFAMPDPDIRSELRFQKNVLIIPGNSEETFPLGLNIFCANLDEAAFYHQTQDHDVAEEIYNALKRRISSRFGSAGILGITSSPRYVDDFIELKVKEAHENPNIIAEKTETWNSRPEDINDILAGNTFELPHPVTGEPTAIPTRYEWDFKRNPEKAWRDLGAIASLVIEAYFKQFDLVKKCIDNRLKNPFISGQLSKEFRGDPKHLYYIHIDLALTQDACGFAMAHKEGENVVVDLIHRIAPGVKKEIDISEPKELVLQLNRQGFKMGKVTYDRFQSASSIQDLKKHHIPSDTLSVDKDVTAYETLKELCYGGRIRFYQHEVFLSEVRRLELIEGKKIDHPRKGSKDVSDAVAGAVYNAVQGITLKTVGVTVL